MGSAVAKQPTKPTPTTGHEPKVLDPNVLYIQAENGKEDAQVYAEQAIKGTACTAVTIRAWRKRGQNEALSVTHCVRALEAEVCKVQAGDLSHVEEMLLGQAQALTAVFHECIRRSALNADTHLDAMERYMRLGLKAQSQCRTTLETLIEAKNPRSVAFVRQANIANGHQQVNNGDARTHATQPNELQGGFNVVDTGT